VKPVEQVSAADVPAVLTALRAALDGGPAVWPVASAARSEPDAPAPTDVQSAAHLRVGDGVALLVETSGSTDAPKRVLLSAGALRASAEATAERLGGHGHWLLALPAHYIAGAQVLVRSIVAGTEPVVLQGERFDPDAFVAATTELVRRDDGRPRYTSLVPVQLARLVDAARADSAHPAAVALRAYAAILVGGQALAEPVRVAAEALGARVVRTYGSSETAGGCVYDGRSLPGVRVRIAADGIVELGGPTLADGYLDDPERTAAAFGVDAAADASEQPGADGPRWYRTGDLGELTSDGVLRVRGRADDVIISGGVKVALGEIERAVRAVPGFAGAVVAPVADPEWGQRAVVVVAGASTDLDRLVAATDAAGLPPAGRPVRVLAIGELPMLASGKPDRRAIARLLDEDAPHRATR
jgi:O-succinylbenzoic acid--CoA ligase